jgi:hypothetical protein
MKISAVTVCVNRSGDLELIVGNKGLFDEWVVVTTDDDVDTMGVCIKNDIEFIVTGRLYEDGAIFNKAKALNDGINHLTKPEWIVTIDSDVLLTGGFRDKVERQVEKDNVYCMDRVTVRNKDVSSVKKIKAKNGFTFGGFFHMFHGDSKKRYDESFTTAGFYDKQFSKLWDKDKRTVLRDIFCFHLGPTHEWRKTQSPIYNDFKQYKVTDDKRFSVVIPFRWSEERQRNVNRAIEFYERFDCEVIIVEIDRKKKFTGKSDKHIFIENGNSFNRSRCLNRGIKESKYDRIVLADADVFMANDNFTFCVESLDKYDLVTPLKYEKMIDIDFESNEFLGFVNSSYTGGISFFRKQMLYKIGGWNEKFIGWGFEDRELYEKMKMVRANILVEDFPVFHLNHPKQKNKQEKRKKNKEMFNKLRTKMSKNDEFDRYVLEYLYLV